MSAQGSPEWFKERLGKITASRVIRITNGTPKGMATFMAALRREIISPDQVLAEEPPFSRAMSHGNRMEDVARAEIELARGIDLEIVGFKTHPSLNYLGASSDSIGKHEDGTAFNCEIKCPFKLDVHLETWQQNRIPDKHIPQVEMQMFVHGVEETLFASYNQEALPEQRLVMIDYKSNADYRQMMLSKCARFWSDFQAYMNNGGVIPLHTSYVPQKF